MSPLSVLSLRVPKARWRVRGTCKSLRLRAVSVASVIATALLAAGGARANELLQTCGGYGNAIFVPSSAYGLGVGGCLYISASAAGRTWSNGQGAIWQANAPAGLTITGAAVPSNSIQSQYVGGSASDWRANFYWTGGSSNINPGEQQTGVLLGNFSSKSFGFLLVCVKSRCPVTQQPAYLQIGSIALSVAETTPPAFNYLQGLWQKSGWVRGTWPLSFSADSPSGVCSLSAAFSGNPLIAPPAASPVLQHWQQCLAPTLDDLVATADYPQGPDQLQIGASDAAGQSSSSTKYVYVDNQQPTVALTGPADVPSTAGTQYVTATASAGPSGVAGISCSVDNAPALWYPTNPAQVSVPGVPGEHQMQCYSQNNALDSNGNRATSGPASFMMKIGAPTVAAVAFSAVVNKLSCRRVERRVLVPARWIKAKRHGKLVRVHRRAHFERRRVTRCHPRTVRRRVTRVVTVRRHGKRVRVTRRKLVRVVLEPRRVYQTVRRVGHGQASMVDGWLGTADGTALSGQSVEVLTAADNGRNNYHVAAVTTTAVNGGWSARLPAGPSRLVTAAYQGSATTESTLATPVHLVVPAKVQLLSVSPRRVAWGGVVRLVGRLRGGYLPPGGALVRLRIGEGSAVTTYGVREHVHGNGRFTTTYHFGVGDASLHRSFWFQIASLPMGDYPYAPANSRRIYVDVGGHPSPPRPTHHHKKNHR